MPFGPVPTMAPLVLTNTPLESPLLVSPLHKRQQVLHPLPPHSPPQEWLSPINPGTRIPVLQQGNAHPPPCLATITVTSRPQAHTEDPVMVPSLSIGDLSLGGQQRPSIMAEASMTPRLTKTDHSEWGWLPKKLLYRPAELPPSVAARTSLRSPSLQPLWTTLRKQGAMSSLGGPEENFVWLTARNTILNTALCAMMTQCYTHCRASHSTN